MKSDRRTGLIAFISTLIAVVLLSKIGGSGADLAIMTGLIGVLGMLAPGLVPSRGNERTPAGTPADPVHVEEKP
ncbi:hypothetical protein [Novosphingobium sp. HII-3]|uniref:hypothetical protein n=1 Tax=Novosphingobium sp. HII-3 TaxID=2075565 RepID=UPI000CDA36B1|nr:hypothetical protein [Novosphingobium sp. HII-3]